MEKNTSLVILSNSATPVNAFGVNEKNEVTPSEQTLKNILNYSKVLRVEQCMGGDLFIEYTAN
jgi:hypothetical protein